MSVSTSSLYSNQPPPPLQVIPAEYQSLVEQYASWNDEIGEWQLRCVAYTGNNMRRSSDTGDDQPTAQVLIHHSPLTQTGTLGQHSTVINCLNAVLSVLNFTNPYRLPLHEECLKAPVVE